jgi:xylulokinase
LPARAGQTTRVQSSIAKIGWLLQHDVEICRWLGAAEATLWSLTGEQVSEPSLACRTGAFDVSARSYLEDVIRLIGAPEDIFPPVRLAGEPHGRVTGAGKGWLGLTVGIPVTVAGHDHMVGAVGVGLSDDDLLDSIGTAETLVRYARDDLDFLQAAALTADVSIDPARGALAVMAGDLRPGRIVESARRMLGDASFEELDSVALSADSAIGEIQAAEGAVLLEQLRSQAGAGVSSASAQVRWRGLIEAMTSYMWNCALGIEPLAGPPARIVLIGGGAKSDAWASAKRRISGLPVARSRVEATAFGAALFAGCAAGYWPAIAEAPRGPLEPVEQ